MMQIRTTPSKPLPYSVSQETMVLGEDTMVSSTSGLDQSNNTPSLHSTGCRLAVVLPKLSNAKGWTTWSSLESVQLSTGLTQHSLTGMLSRADLPCSSVRDTLVGGQPHYPTPIVYLGAPSSERVCKNSPSGINTGA